MKRLEPEGRTLERRPNSPMMTAVTMAVVFVACPVTAMELDTGTPDVKMRWDNTVKYSAGYRLHDPDPALSSDPSVANLNDGDSNFRRGPISNRLDLLSEFETTYRTFGLRLSGAAWYDTVYNQHNDNTTGPVNSTEVADQTSFTPYTRKVHGRKAELLDAFVSGRFDLGGRSATVRLGQHTVQWGETLFFGDNGIAGAMSPVDIAKALSVPNLRFQEILRPVPQVSGQLEINSRVTAYAYYQFRWRENRSPGSGSYFAPIDFGPGGNLIFTGPTSALSRLPTREGKDSGQGGVSLRIRGDDVDYGIYAVRFNNKTSQIVSGPAGYYEAFHNGINAFGASASRSIGLFNFAIEASIRNNQDLLSTNALDVGLGPTYAVGKTAHVNISAFGTNLGSTPLWSDASLLAEIAFSRVLSVKSGADTLSGCSPAFVPGSVCAPNGTRDAFRLQVLFEPVYYQVLPGLDLRTPIGVSYVPRGSRNMVGSAPLAENAGTLNVGISASYLDVWRAGLTYSHFYGSQGPFAGSVSPATQAFSYRNYYRDRDYVSFVLSRTF